MLKYRYVCSVTQIKKGMIQIKILKGEVV